MRKLVILLALSFCCVSVTLAKEGFGPGEQEWGHVEVRPKAYMFWWLYFTTANVNSFYDKPLLIWLEGGPGASSTFFGSFEQFGPLDTDLKPRNHTWVKDYNVLFIDSPVGTGFSYVNDTSAYTTTNAQIADDLMTYIKEFFQKFPQFTKVSTYIITESYGGKMGAEFALVWFKEQKAGTITSNLKGITLGDPWISPIDSVLCWAPFLLSTGIIDTPGAERISSYAERILAAVVAKEWDMATNLLISAREIVLNETYNVDFFNILTKVPYTSGHVNSSVKNVESTSTNNDIEEEGTYKIDKGGIMNGPVRKALGLKVVHHAFDENVYKMLMTDIMKPVVHIVEQLLNDTNLKVIMITGQLDLIIDTPGTLIWVDTLKWNGSRAWFESKRRPLVANGIIEGFVKSYDTFSMYWMSRAGHLVPKDNPAGMAKVLDHLTAE